jgi:hypothetical protein
MSATGNAIKPTRAEMQLAARGLFQQHDELYAHDFVPVLFRLPNEVECARLMAHLVKQQRTFEAATALGKELIVWPEGEALRAIIDAHPMLGFTIATDGLLVRRFEAPEKSKRVRR